MTNEKEKELLKEREKIARQMPRSSKIIKGTIVKLKRRCGKKRCHCVEGEKHESMYLSQSQKGKTRMIYIPGEKEKEVEENVRRYKKLIETAEALSEINIKIIKGKK